MGAVGQHKAAAVAVAAADMEEPEDEVITVVAAVVADMEVLVETLMTILTAAAVAADIAELV